MNCLLDTHSFLWLVFEPSHLSEGAKTVIKDPANNVHLSVLSYWEISLKYALGKLILKNCTPEKLIPIAHKLDLEMLELSPEDAAGFHRLPKMPHKDPFDRMLIWQAIQRNLILISRDKAAEAYRSSGLKTLW